MPGRLTMPRGQSFQPRKPLRGSQPTGAQGRREGEVGGIEEAEEAAIEYDVGVEAATGVEAGVSSAGVSKADEGDTKLSFFFKNSSLRLAFLRIVEGLGFFFFLAWLSKASSFESKEKAKPEAKVRENLKALPWLFSAWQNSRHLVAKSVSLTAVIFGYF